MIDLIKDDNGLDLVDSEELSEYMMGIIDGMYVFDGVDKDGEARRYRFSETVLMPISGNAISGLMRTETFKRFIMTVADWYDDEGKITNFAAISSRDIVFVPVGAIEMLKDRKQEQNLIDVLLSSKENLLADKPTILGDFEFDGEVKQGKVLQVVAPLWLKELKGKEAVLNDMEETMIEVMIETPSVFDRMMGCDDIYGAERTVERKEERRALHVKEGYKALDNFRRVVKESPEQKMLRLVMDCYDEHFSSEKTQKVINAMAKISESIGKTDSFMESIKSNREDFEQLAKLEISKTDVSDPEQIMLKVMGEHMVDLKKIIKGNKE